MALILESWFLRYVFFSYLCIPDLAKAVATCMWTCTAPAQQSCRRIPSWNENTLCVPSWLRGEGAAMYPPAWNIGRNSSENSLWCTVPTTFLTELRGGGPDLRALFNNCLANSVILMGSSCFWTTLGSVSKTVSRKFELLPWKSNSVSVVSITSSRIEVCP